MSELVVRYVTYPDHPRSRAPSSDYLSNGRIEVRLGAGGEGEPLPKSGGSLDDEDAFVATGSAPYETPEGATVLVTLTSHPPTGARPPLPPGAPPGSDPALLDYTTPLCVVRQALESAGGTTHFVGDRLHPRCTLRAPSDGETSVY